MSLMTPSRASLAVPIRSANRRSWSGRALLFRSRPEKPMTLVNGVLSSWDMLDRKSDLARAAASAASLAAISSSSSALAAVMSRSALRNSTIRPSSSRMQEDRRQRPRQQHSHRQPPCQRTAAGPGAPARHHQERRRRDQHPEAVRDQPAQDVWPDRLVVPQVQRARRHDRRSRRPGQSRRHGEPQQGLALQQRVTQFGVAQQPGRDGDLHGVGGRQAERQQRRVAHPQRHGHITQEGPADQGCPLGPGPQEDQRQQDAVGRPDGRHPPRFSREHQAQQRQNAERGGPDQEGADPAFPHGLFGTFSRHPSPSPEVKHEPWRFKPLNTVTRCQTPLSSTQSDAS